MNGARYMQKSFKSLEIFKQEEWLSEVREQKKVMKIR